MGFGILEPKDRSIHVAGTVVLDQQAAQSTDAAASANLKHASGKNSHIILAPQPSNDPNDPLTWGWLEKQLILTILCFGAIVNASVIGPMTAAGTVDISIALGVTVNDIALTTGYLLLATGATGPFVSCFARKFGKRPVYLFSSLACLIGCIIGEIASSFNVFLAARVVQGLGVSAYESLVMASIADLFFVHERGPRVALVQFILAAISNFVAILAGPITANLGYKYNFHILLPFTALQLILTFLFVPETTYRRATIYNIDTVGSEEDLNQLANIEARKERHAAQRAQQSVSEKETIDMEEGPKAQRQISTLSAPPPTRKTFVQRLKIYNGVFVQDSIFKMLAAFIVCFANIGILFNTVVSGVIIAFFVAISILSAVIFYAPPYLFNAAGVGYTSTGPLIGGILGSIFCGLTFDPSIKWMTKRNKGIYEPEFRLPAMFIGCLTTVAGLASFGYTIEQGQSIYIVCTVWGLLLFGMSIIATAIASYTVDAFREYATEAFVANMVFKNFFFYGLSTYVIEWYLTRGATELFGTAAGITGGLCLLTIPLYIYGKRYRLFWQQHNLVKKFNLETDKTGAEGE